MNSLVKIITLCFCVSLTACGGGAAVVTPAPINYTPDLRYFDIVDSYGIDSAKQPYTQLTLDPFKDSGLFDVFWGVNSLEDYRVNVRINDSSYVSKSLLIYSEVCGRNLACDQNGAVICQYTSDYYMSCGDRREADIKVLFNRVPQNLYMILEVCDMDSSYCTYQYLPVRMQ
jgi:hypothetical protein